MALPLPSLSLTKTAVFGLAVAVIAGVVWVTSLERPEGPTRSAKTEGSATRRGDDPTYADELRKLTALLQDMRYRFDQTENQRILDQDRLSDQTRTATAALARQSKAEIERLNKALEEAKKALDQKIQEAAAVPTDAVLREQIEKLQADQEALRRPLAGEGGPGGPSEAGSDRRPEANRILNPSSASRPNDTAPGALELAPGGLEMLRQLPGMAGLADRLEAQTKEGSPVSSGPPGKRIEGKNIAGLPDDYVALTPFAGAPRTGASAAASVSYAPKPYPFTVKAGPDGASAVIPVYTLPDAATLVQNATMTPLVGRVPFRGRLRDPFRFKLITGATNLASNGHHIPGIANAVWTGYVVGVREQSCARAYIDTVTFTFEDGRIHTVHKGKGNTSKDASVQDNLGFLTDQWGKPCIRGQYFNNAGAYLRDRGVAAFLDGLADAYANAQLTTYNNDGLTTYVSGNTYAYAGAKGIATAAGDIAQYVAERAEDAFDVIYVPPGIQVQIFVESQIPIDYDTDGRKLHYSYLQRASHDPLD